MPTLAAVIPATDRPPTLATCERAIGDAEQPPEQVIVVDAPAGAGPAHARNLGAERAGADVLVFVDSDVVVHRDAFARIRNAFDSDGGLCAVFGSYDDRPSAPGTVSVFRNLLHHHVHQEAAGAASTFWAGLGAVRRDAFLRVGGFDANRYPESSIEDIELGVRLTAGGERIALDPELQGTHLKRWGLREMVATDFRRRGIPWTMLLLRGGGTRASTGALNVGWRHRLSAVSVVAGCFGVVVRRPLLPVIGAAALAALNVRFYRLLVKRQGLLRAIAGVGLHVLHHLAGSAAVPVGLALHLREDRAAAGVGAAAARSAAADPPG